MENCAGYWYFGNNWRFVLENQNFLKEIYPRNLQKAIDDWLSYTLRHSQKIFKLADPCWVFFSPRKTLNVSENWMNQCTEHLNIQLQYIDIVLKMLNNLNRFRYQLDLHNIFVERKRPDMIGRGIIGKNSDCSQKVIDKVDIIGLVDWF